MLQVLPGRATPFVGGGPFRIRLMRPGLIEGRPMADPVIGPLSRVDHAFLDVGTVVSRHQHRNDEILSYMWRGLMVHEDSTGRRVELTPSRLMMMNAGRGFSHEETPPAGSTGQPLQGPSGSRTSGRDRRGRTDGIPGRIQRRLGGAGRSGDDRRRAVAVPACSRSSWRATLHCI